MRQVQWLVLVAAVAAAAPVEAFPWMVRHGYNSCAVCHVDPSGGGQLTLYGRAQSDVLLRWKLNKPKKDAEVEVSPSANFLWFLELPEAVNLSGNVRAGALLRPGSTPAAIPLVMATDLYGTVNIDRWTAHLTTGLGIKNVNEAIVLPACDSGTGPCSASLVAREFWAGAKFNDEAVVLRVGRMNVPFGLRNNEHNSFVRALTRTDINLDQQVGAAAAYNGDDLRGELMGIFGNYQVGPDAYRERGYSASMEFGLEKKAYVGLSSLITHAGGDLLSGRPLTRHAHGVFTRWAPVEPLSLIGELDLLVSQSPGLLDKVGFVFFAQGEYELAQGLHLIGTLEAKHEGAGERGPSLGLWAGAAWYALPHMELRVDAIIRRVTSPGLPDSNSVQVLAQVHFFL